MSMLCGLPQWGAAALVLGPFAITAEATEAAVLTAATAQKLPACSLLKTDNTCKPFMDRKSPAVPSTVQISSRAHWDHPQRGTTSFGAMKSEVPTS
jgi:hypothetical protein